MKSSKGITLIVLVITIIVLLILAGVSISLTLGNNGVLNQATNAVTKNKNASAKEDVEMAWAGAVSSYWAELASDSSKQMDKTFLTPKLVGKTSNGEINSVDDNGDGTYIVYYTANGETEQQSFLMDEQGRASKLIMPNTTDLRSMYGTEVSGYTGYTATDVTGWQLLYVDENNNEAFIVTTNVISGSTNPIKQVSESGVNYTGSNSVASLDYGQKYNGLWLGKITTEQTYPTAKQTAYMCDSINWERYKGKKAKYAVGSPTTEIIIASHYNVQVDDFKSEGYTGPGKRIVQKVSSDGYNDAAAEYTSQCPLKTSSWIALDTSYKLASPWSMKSWHPVSSQPDGLQGVFSGSGFLNSSDTNTGFRPTVCLPLYALEIVENGGTKTLKIAD